MHIIYTKAQGLFRVLWSTEQTHSFQYENPLSDRQWYRGYIFSLSFSSSPCSIPTWRRPFNFMEFSTKLSALKSISLIYYSAESQTSIITIKKLFRKLHFSFWKLLMHSGFQNSVEKHRTSISIFTSVVLILCRLR